MFATLGAMGAAGATSVMQGFINDYFNEKAEDRAFRKQQWMASNAHQLEVADLRAAGLNPILSAMGGSGASFPTAAMATPSTQGALANSSNVLLNLQKEKLESEIVATKSASAESLARAEETRRRTDYEYGKKGSVGVLGPDGKPLAGGDHEISGARARELEASIALMQEQAKKLGFENVQSAAKAGVYEKWKMLPEIEKALELGSDAVGIAAPVRKMLSAPVEPITRRRP